MFSNIFNTQGISVKLLKNFNETTDLYFHLTCSNKVKRSSVFILFLPRYDTATPKRGFPEIIPMSFKVVNINYKPTNQYSPCQLFFLIKIPNELWSSRFEKVIHSEGRERYQNEDNVIKRGSHPPHIHQNMATVKKVRKKEKEISSVSEDVEKPEPLCIVGNVKWCSLYTKQTEGPHKIIISSNSTSGNPKRTEGKVSNTYPYTHVHSSMIHKSQRQKETK